MHLTPLHAPRSSAVRRWMAWCWLLQAAPLLAYQPADLEGFWLGKAEGGDLPAPIDVTMDLWMEEGKLTGMLAHPFGVSKLDSVTLKNDEFTTTFLNFHLGAGAVSGKIAEGKTCEFKWHLGGGEGTGTIAWQDPALQPAISPEQLAGKYAGKALSPFFHEHFDISLVLAAGGEKITGNLYVPVGVYEITRVIRRKNRLFIECRSQEEDQGVILASLFEDHLETFWSGYYMAGSARLEKLPAEAAPDAPAPSPPPAP